jgi:hypothetical protein
MAEWFLSEACDGFNVMFPYCRAGSTTSSTTWCLSCNDEDSSAEKSAGRSDRVLACRDPQAASFHTRNLSGALRSQSSSAFPRHTALLRDCVLPRDH